MAMRKPHNWLQLIRLPRWASGYVVNLAVFAACVMAWDRLSRAAVLAFMGVGGQQLLVEPPLDVRRQARGARSSKLSVSSRSRWSRRFTYVVLMRSWPPPGAEVVAQAVAIVAGRRCRSWEKLWSFRA